MVRRALKRVVFLSWDLTYLFPPEAGWNWHLVLLTAEQVVKASQGHYPQPFLISK